MKFLGHCLAQGFRFKTAPQKRRRFAFHLYTTWGSPSTMKMPTKAFLDLQAFDIFSKKI